MESQTSHVLANTPSTSSSNPFGPLRQVDQWKALDSWRDSGPPIRHRSAVGIRRTADGPWRETFELIKTMIGSGYIVALLGIRGCGKTLLAACIGAETVQVGRTVIYHKSTDLFRLIRSCYRDGGPDETRTINQLVYCGLLIIDELNERAETDFERRTLTNIIDRRYDRGADTLLISNESKEAFAASVGASIASRIVETGKAIECNWESFRQPGGTPLRTAEEIEHARTVTKVPNRG